MFVVLSLDPGFSSPALALQAKEGQRWSILRLPVLHSLDDLAAELAEIHHSGIHVDVCAYEEVDWSLHTKDPEVKRGNGSGLILDSVGQARLFAKIRRIPFVGVTGQTWRRAMTGRSTASKEECRTAAMTRVLGWPKGRIGLNRSDAVCIGVAAGAVPAHPALVAAAARVKSAKAQAKRRAKR
jgi:hypothetical protein